MMKENFNDFSNPDGEKVDLKKEISYFLFFWPWFLLTIVMSLIGSYVYLRYSPEIYKTSAQVQITKSDASSSFLTTDVTSLFGTRVNVDNDISVITSNHILSQVVKNLDLQTSITGIGRVKSSIKFGKEVPFEIQFKNPNYFQIWNLVFSNGSVLISNDTLNFRINKNETLDNNYFFFNLKNNLSPIKDSEYKIQRTSLNYATSALKKRLIASPGSKNNGEIINLDISGTNILRNEAILNTLIQVVKTDRIEDERQLSSSTIEFINERLETLKNTLNSISKRTIEYQLENNIYDSKEQTSNLLSSIVKENEASFTLQIQLEIATSLLKQLKNQVNFEILPSNIGIADAGINELLISYNTLVMDRNTLLISATKNSPLVSQINDQLNRLRKANLEGISRYIENLQVSISSYQKINDKTSGIVAEFPEKDYTMRTLAREFKFAEDLLVFLSQRKEEASISYVSVIPNLKVLSYGITDFSPISPKKNTTYLAAIVFGFIFPFTILLLMKTLDTKINTREDLEKGLPGLSVLGEVPFDENYSSENDDRGIIAESTRVIRSSMSFLLNQNKPQVIITTSTIKGEGKSFVSYNIAQSYNALGKKVILIGADLRNPQVHTLLGIERGNLGLSTFLNDVNYNDLDKLIVKGKSIDEIDYLLSGAIPPNPSELLMRPRMKELLEILKSTYDLIIIDTAPLLLVSDTTPLLPLCDLVVYVSRAQYSDKNIFPFIKDIHSRENMPPFGMVLNALIASPTSSSYGYGYRYSYKYRYSYTYKYNYGYGYGYGRDED
ncbi:polysaccharide biosynthesis tyrosine autokinase [Flavobacteriaceae bacterium]|nr:polysaccharide biosynthesis tyrosine autokinase [Flavobacteriaceae bacterium]